MPRWCREGQMKMKAFTTALAPSHFFSPVSLFPPPLPLSFPPSHGGECVCVRGVCVCVCVQSRRNGDAGVVTPSDSPSPSVPPSLHPSLPPFPLSLLSSPTLQLSLCRAEETEMLGLLLTSSKDTNLEREKGRERGRKGGREGGREEEVGR